MNLSILFKLIIIFFLALSVINSQNNKSGRIVSITIDDLPFTGEPKSLDAEKYLTSKIIDTLMEFNVPAHGFVTGKNVFIKNEVDERLNILRKWRDGGVQLENHGFNHLSFNKTPVQVYLDDLIKGHSVAEIITNEIGDSVKFFRTPFNQTGKSDGDKKLLIDFLTERELILAPFTIEHSDYIFNALYVNAINNNDSLHAYKIGKAYLEQINIAFNFAEELSKETFGTEIPQIFLIHANRINADYLGKMLNKLKERGYTFNSLDKIMNAKVYSSIDGYAGPWGISWLHRWRKGLGLKNLLREEPDPPDWILDEYSELNNKN